MNYKSLFTTCILLSLTAFSATATEPVKEPKYCGSGFTEKLVPEAPFKCDMSAACKAHDACYGKCDPGGELHGKPYCEKSEFSAERRQAKARCEQNFYADIVKANPGRWVCKGVGAIYVGAVGVVGQGPFNGRQLNIAGMEDLLLTSNSEEELKAKMQTMAVLSQRGLIDLQQPKRVQDKLVFDRLPKGGALVAPKIDFSKGALQKDLQKLQSLEASK